MTTWPVLLLAATALHAGFQLTVTALVYPALVRVAPAQFPQAHHRHSRGIVPLVALVYGSAAIAGVGALVTSPAAVSAWVAVLATGAAVALTAFRAAPLHGRLGRHGPDPELLAALLRADAGRTACALLALVAALAHAL